MGGRRRQPGRLVITSYSIHYTKLYDAGDDAAGTEWTLSPSLSLSLRQPLFAGGQLIPTGAASDAKASAAIGAEQAAIDDLSRRNQAVRSAVETAGRVMLLRRTLVVQDVITSYSIHYTKLYEP